MSVIVKSTPEAIDAITSMRSIIEGVLASGFDQLVNKGDTAGNPNNWDGPLAEQFRNMWSVTTADLRKLRTDLGELQQYIAKVQANIQAAGGAA